MKDIFDKWRWCRYWIVIPSAAIPQYTGADKKTFAYFKGYDEHGKPDFSVLWRKAKLYLTKKQAIKDFNKVSRKYECIVCKREDVNLI